jgi:hypothetical protein
VFVLASRLREILENQPRDVMLCPRRCHVLCLSWFGSNRAVEILGRCCAAVRQPLKDSITRMCLGKRAPIRKSCSQSGVTWSSHALFGQYAARASVDESALSDKSGPIRTVCRIECRPGHLREPDCRLLSGARIPNARRKPLRCTDSCAGNWTRTPAAGRSGQGANWGQAARPAPHRRS